LKQAFRRHAEIKRMLPALTADVAQGRVAASTAARQLLEAAQKANDPGSSPG
jgi:LAO/AO transport system kinase